VRTMADPVVVCPSCGTKNRVPVAASGHPRCPTCQTDLPWLVDVSDDDFDRAVATPKLVVVDLWAPWCGPCRMVAPTLERLSRDFAGRLKVVKVNVDDAPMTAQRYEARSIPMLLFMRGGEVINTVVGAQPEHVLRTLVEGELRVNG
jgi:thioredoxin 2